MATADQPLAASRRTEATSPAAGRSEGEIIDRLDQVGDVRVAVMHLGLLIGVPEHTLYQCVSISEIFRMTSLDFHGAEFANGDQRVVILQSIETNHKWLVAQPGHRGRFVSES